MMTNKKLLIMAVVALVMIVVNVVLYVGWSSRGGDFKRGTLLIQGLAPDNIAKITISGDKETLNLVRKDNRFVVKERQNYPAEMGEVNKLLLKCLKVRCDAKITESADNHDELGVGKDKPETGTVTFLDEKDKELIGIVVGKHASRGGGSYVRRSGQDVVYASEESVFLSAQPSNYMDTKLLEVKKDDVAEAIIKSKDKACTVTRDKDGKIVLNDVPKGKRPKESDVESVFDALSSLTLDDVAADASVAADPDTTFTCKLKEDKHIVYVVQLAKRDDKHYIKVSAIGPTEDEVRKSEAIARDGRLDGTPEGKKAAAILTGDNVTGTFNKRHSNWVYEISSWSAGKMRKGIEDLIEDIPKPDDPDKITASHILIGYKGADRSKATRTKDEARKRAEEVLKKAKAPGADFAALAKEYSDGPTKDKGGDLGEFEKGKMHKNFEAAAWKLKVGEISGIVETPFGFHVIKRTK